MFVWQPDNDDADDDLGQYWEAIVKHVESPVRHSLHSFILNVDHEVIRVFREALNGPAGRQTKRGAFLEPDFWYVPIYIRVIVYMFCIWKFAVRSINVCVEMVPLHLLLTLSFTYPNGLILLIYSRASADANLPHNKNVRTALGLEDRARFITSWDAFGM